MALELQANSETTQGLPAFRNHLVASGYQEAITYSFVDPSLQRLIDPQIEPVPLANPISADMSVMRTSLWPGLLSTAVHNLNRQQSRVRIVEAGQCIVRAEKENNASVLGFKHRHALAGLNCGTRVADG